LNEKEILAYVEHQEKKRQRATAINIAIGLRSPQLLLGEFHFKDIFFYVLKIKMYITCSKKEKIALNNRNKILFAKE